LSAQELSLPSAVERAGHAGSYWVLVAGGKLDFTAKWWPPEYYQAVVDHFAGRIQFVQCGGGRDRHPPLRRVLSLVGRTDLRQLVRVIYGAEGVVCPVTFAMHLAAAVPVRGGAGPLRPCVVIAGGREPPHWEAYPGHQFLHTVGALDCCATGGCWKSRCQPVGDGDPKDRDLCRRPTRVGEGPLVGQCMAMVTPQRVTDAIELYCSERDPVETTGPRAGKPPIHKRSAGSTAVECAITVRSRGVAVTIGTGALERMAQLAAREVRALTGLETVVLGQRELSASGFAYPTLLKFRLFDFVNAEHLMYFDADMVCLRRWDPKQYFGRREIVAVRDRMFDTIRNEASTWDVPVEDYFNAGFFIASAIHHREWLRLAEAILPTRPTAMLDQTVLNAARQQLSIPLHLIDRRYNWLGFGGNSLSLDAPVVMAHKLVPTRVEINTDYFEGRYDLFESNLVFDDSEAARLAGRSFLRVRDGVFDAQRLHLRSDGTILPAPNPDAPGYWFVHVCDGRPRLALASEGAIAQEFHELVGGSWVPVGEDDVRLVDEALHCEQPVDEDTARPTAQRFLDGLGDYPAAGYAGQGIVICGGGPKYLPCAWVCIRMLRHLGCTLPVELWQLRATEGDPRLVDALLELNVRCVSAAEVRRQHPVRFLAGYELKPYAVLHSAFDELIYLDADNVPVREPSYLFSAPQYADTGAVFWPDFGRLGPDAAIWRVCGVPYRDEPEFESGQMLIDKRKCWRPLNLTVHMNGHSDFYYRYVHGDKDTFHFAWRMLGREYSMVPHPIHALSGTMCQHDFEGRRLFQHRNVPKWTVRNDNPRVDGFAYEDECLGFLEELSTLLK
jgi:hypothetical protein